AYGASVEDVLARNGLREGDPIKPGQRLVIVTRPSASTPRHPETAVAPARRGADPDAPVLEPGKAEARKGTKPPAQIGPDRTFLWPTRGIITSRFGWRRYQRHHGGVDLASPHGTPIYATRDGVVSFAGWRNGYGQVVYIDHGAGLTTIYGHASELLVAAGKKVKRGEMIARVGCTGWCTGAHLHFEVRINDVAVNPLQYLR
ncbi:MAG TPA: LysM peptidoglycan-binding domain-containing M23 family metallopeptidase, partial [bacterium]|nr:LysM peptidoglycan-binding domain-containing M23 family metallopeptidase [bacterium]